MTHSESETSGRSDTSGRSSGESETKGGGTGRSRGNSQANGQSEGSQDGESSGGSKGHTKSVTRKTVLIPRHRIEEVDTGKLVDSIGDQAERQKHQIYTLDTGEAIVKFRRMPYAFIIQTDFVKEVYPNEEVKFQVLEWGEELVFAQHPYNHVPRIEGAQDERIARLLGAAPSANGKQVDPTGGVIA